jgi:hypothetical protein
LQKLQDVFEVSILCDRLAWIAVVAIILSVQSARAKGYPVEFAPPYLTEADCKLAGQVGIDKPDFLLMEKLSGCHPQYFGLSTNSSPRPQLDGHDATDRKGVEMPLADWCSQWQSKPKPLANRCNPRELVLSLRSALAKKPYMIVARTSRYNKGGRDPFLCVFPRGDQYRVLELYRDQVRREQKEGCEYLSKTDHAAFLQQMAWTERETLSNADFGRLQAQLKEWEARYHSAIVGIGPISIYFPSDCPSLDSVKSAMESIHPGIWDGQFEQMKMGKIVNLNMLDLNW